MLVKSILKVKGPDVVDIGPDVSVMTAMEVLAKHRVGALLVRDERKNLLGILSERDIVRALPKKGAAVLDGPVKDLMTRAVVCCSSTETVDSLMSLMTEKRIRHVPVMEDGKLLGLVSIGDVVKHKIAEAEMEAQALKNYITTG